MSDKVDIVEGTHGPAIIEGPLTALSWLTVLPIKHGVATAFDRTTGARVITSLPVVGAAYGLVAAATAAACMWLGASALLTGVLTVLAMELFGRFMHLDGLGDVADALGSYGSPEKAREILADPHIGLIGAGAGLLSLLAQIAAVAELSTHKAVWVLAVTVAMGRLGVLFVAHERHRPMKPTGFGAMLIGTIPTWRIVAWALAFLALALLSSARIPLLLALVAVECSGFVLARHCHRRFEGLNGDTCGFVIHVGTAIALVVSALAVSALA